MIAYADLVRGGGDVREAVRALRVSGLIYDIAVHDGHYHFSVYELVFRNAEKVFVDDRYISEFSFGKRSHFVFSQAAVG